MAVKTSAVLLNAVSLCRAQAAEMPRLRQSAPWEKGEEGVKAFSHTNLK